LRDLLFLSISTIFELFCQVHFCSFFDESPYHLLIFCRDKEPVVIPGIDTVDGTDVNTV